MRVSPPALQAPQQAKWGANTPGPVSSQGHKQRRSATTVPPVRSVELWADSASKWWSG